MKAADRSGAPLVVVIGERDLEAGVAQVKSMDTGDQVPVPLGELATYVRSVSVSTGSTSESDTRSTSESDPGSTSETTKEQNQ
jgi:hypothetical protein